MLTFIPLVCVANSDGNFNFNYKYNHYNNKYSSNYRNLIFTDKSNFELLNGPKKKKKGGIFGNTNKNRNYNRDRLNSRKYGRNEYFSLPFPLAIKTNLAYNAIITSNLALEIPFKRRYSIEIHSTYNAWVMKDNVKWKNIIVMPELRYWLKRSMEGKYFGVHLGWSRYNIGGLMMPYFSDAKYYRYDGWAVALGVSFGKQARLFGNLYFDMNIGLGVIYTEYDKYLQPKCGAYWGTFKNILVAPTKIGLSLVYLIE